MNLNVLPLLRLAIGFLVCGYLSACSNSDYDTIEYDDQDSSLAFPLPKAIAASRAIDQADVTLDLRLTLASDTSAPAVVVSMTWNGTNWTGSTLLEINQTYQLNGIWRHINNPDFPLATLTLTVVVANDNVQLAYNQDNYVYPNSDGDGFSNLVEIDAGTDPNDPDDFPTTTPPVALDTDGDGFTDVDEVAAGTDPNDPDDNPDTVNALQGVDVAIPRISEAQAPAIDGSYDDIWDEARFTDTDGIQLAIDNLMEVEGTAPLDLAPSPFRWAAMHDSVNLYMIIFGELVENANLWNDSQPKPWNDDSFEIFFDSNYSRTAPLDGVDDLSLIIGMLDASGTQMANSSSSSQPVMIRGANSAPLVEAVIAQARYATCVCASGQHFLEIAFPLLSLNIPLNAKFGIEVEINDDIDGDTRDRKWGWKHPARENDVNTDFAFEDARLFGTGYLQ